LPVLAVDRHLVGGLGGAAGTAGRPEHRDRDFFARVGERLHLPQGVTRRAAIAPIGEACGQDLALLPRDDLVPFHAAMEPDLHQDGGAVRDHASDLWRALREIFTASEDPTRRGLLSPETPHSVLAPRRSVCLLGARQDLPAEFDGSSRPSRTESFRFRATRLHQPR